jgi:hypothetical protein
MRFPWNQLDTHNPVQARPQASYHWLTFHVIGSETNSAIDMTALSAEALSGG